MDASYWRDAAHMAPPLLAYFAVPVALLCAAGAALTRRSRGSASLWAGYATGSVLAGLALVLLAMYVAPARGPSWFGAGLAVASAAAVLLPPAVALAAFRRAHVRASAAAVGAAAIGLAALVAAGPFLTLGLGCVLTGDCL